MEENNNNNIYRALDAKTDSRLAFVNPNAAYGGVNGVPFTPPYEDMCISVNLEIEVVHRTKTDNVGYNSAEMNGNKYVMSWTSNYQVDEKGNFTGKTLETEPIYFMQGRDAQEYLDGISKEKFLTTYYTDISVEDIRNRNIIEGLGITSVDIAYDNMYMPTITIKFVDVRGSSLFGREEEVHNDNSITSETIFGCFFTLPYPKFRLHVKGFFGDAVTYQLACTGFKGNFNSQTGNFEITTTFIGYQYSLLTDIPFVLLIAAPYCEYIGEKYWDRHVKKPEWQLSDGARMKKLYEMYTNLKKELKEGISDGKTATSIDLSSSDIAVKQLNGIWDEIKSAIKGRCTYMGYTKEGEAYKDTTTNEIHFLCFTKEEMNIYEQSIGHKLANMKEEIEKYNAKFTDQQLSFKIPETFSNSNETKTPQLIDYGKDNGNNVHCKVTSYTYTCEGLKKFVESKIKEETSNQYAFFEDKIYGYEFSDGGYEHSANLVIEGINTKKEEEVAKAKAENKDYVPEEISKALEFKPSIGNFFKIIIAHLETFTAMMYGCSSTILKQMKNGGRAPQKLGVNFDNTDVMPSQKFIPPFPAVFKKEVNRDETDESDTKGIMTKALGWVGDFSANFEEEKLIVSIFNAAQRIVEGKEKLHTKKNVDVSKLFPSLPLDLYTDNTMTSIGSFTTDMLAALLGVRMTQIFGILNDGNLTDNDKDIAEAHGKMDALNLYQAVSKKSEIRDTLFTEKKSDGDKKDDNTSNYVSKEKIVHDIMYCLKNNEAEEYAILDKNNNVVKYEYEYHSYGKPSGGGAQYIYEGNPRYMQPIMVQSNKLGGDASTSTYTYIWGGTNGNEFGIVPVRMQDPSGIFGQYVFNRVDEGNTKSSLHNINLHSVGVEEYSDGENGDYVTNNNILHNVSSKKLLQGSNDANTFIKYFNESVFNVITDKDVIKAIEDRCELLKKDDIKIDGYDGKIDNFKVIIDRYYDFNVEQYLTDEKNYIAKAKTDTLSSDKIEKDKINTTQRQFEISVDVTDANNPKFETRENINKKLEFIDMKKAFNTTDFNNCFVPYCLCECDDDAGTDKHEGYTVSLDITTPFLNDYGSMINLAKETEEQQANMTFINALKIWWLIQTVPLKWEKTSNIIKTNGKHGCVKKVPLAMVLLLGGAIYLTKHMKKHQGCKFYDSLQFSFNDILVDESSGFKDQVKNGRWINNSKINAPSKFSCVSSIQTYENLENNEPKLKTFLYKKNGAYKLRLTFTKGSNTKVWTTSNPKNWLYFKDIFGGDDYYKWAPDNVIGNKLCMIFEEWALTKGMEILNGMMSAPYVSWAANGTFMRELIKLSTWTNPNARLALDDEYYDAAQHVALMWGAMNGTRNTGCRYPYTSFYLKYGRNVYCNYFPSVWGATPIKGWSEWWFKQWHEPVLGSEKAWYADEDANSIIKKCVELYSGRITPPNGYCNWMENDLHWLSIFSPTNKEHVAYWKSDVSFREALLELYTSSCLVCINSPSFNKYNSNKKQDV